MIDRRDWHGNIETIEIYASAIDKAKADMTGKWFGFKSRVIDVISDGDRALITIETCGRLPLVRKRWDKYLIPDQERKAIGVGFGVHDDSEGKGNDKKRKAKKDMSGIITILLSKDNEHFYYDCIEDCFVIEFNKHHYNNELNNNITLPEENELLIKKGTALYDVMCKKFLVYRCKILG